MALKVRIVPSNGAQNFELEVNPEDTVDFLYQQISLQNSDLIPIRLIYGGKEMKPKAARLSSFDVGKHGNFVIHVQSKEVIKIAEETPLSATIKSNPDTICKTGVVDLTVDDNDDVRLVAISANSAERSSKRRRDVIETTSIEKRAARYRSTCPQDVRDRISRAISQRMYLIHQIDTSSATSLSRQFAVLGSTGNVYDVTIGQKPHCTCPDCAKGNLCKHIIFVMIKVLRQSRESSLVYQKALLQTELQQLFASPIASTSAAVQAKKDVVREYKAVKGLISAEEAEKEHKEEEKDFAAGAATRAGPAEDTECPVCFENVCASSKKEPVAACSVCNNYLHRDCIQRWLATDKKNQSCPYCRSAWVDSLAPTSSSSACKTGGGGGTGTGTGSREGYINLGGLQGLPGTRDTSTYNYGRYGRWGYDGDRGDY